MLSVLYYTRWILAAPLFVFFMWAAILNLWVCATAAAKAWRKSGGRVPSIAPLAGGVSGAVALQLCPVDSISRYAWLP